MLVTVTPLLAQAKEAAAAVGLSDDAIWSCSTATGTRRRPGIPTPPTCSQQGLPAPRGELRPVVASRGAAVQLRHHRQPQGRDADAPQPGGQRRADPAAARDGRRRRGPGRAAVLPHLRNDGAAQRRAARAGPAGHHAELRPRASSSATSQNHKCTIAFIAPPVAVALAKHPLVDDYDLSSLNGRHVRCRTAGCRPRPAPSPSGWGAVSCRATG